MRLIQTPLVEDFEYICSVDDALDRSGEDFLQLLQEANESGDFSQVPLKPGRKPVVWKLRHLQGVVRRRLRDMCIAAQMEGEPGIPSRILFHACRLGLVSVSGLVNNRNQPVKIAHYPEEEAWGRAPAVAIDQMEWLGAIEGLDPDVREDAIVNELGAVVLSRMGPSKN